MFAGLLIVQRWGMYVVHQNGINRNSMNDESGFVETDHLILYIKSYLPDTNA